jgi:large subunit ribosomal protein L13
MSTFVPTAQNFERKWYVMDAQGQTLGRLASRAARVLSGKNSPKYTPYIDTGDHVIVINADKVKITGMKAEQKIYHHYTGFPGGLRSEAFNKRRDRRPEQIIELAIKGMLPKNKIGRAMGSKLKVYKGDQHPHKAQMPEVLANKVQ